MAALREVLDARARGAATDGARDRLEALLTPASLANTDGLLEVVRQALHPGATDLKPGNVRALEFAEGALRSEPLHYAVRLPRDYGDATGPWPLLIALPRVDESGAEHLRLRWGDASVTERCILVAP